MRLLTLALTALALGGATAPAKQVRAGETIQWSMSDRLKIYRLGDMTAKFDRVQCAPLGEECEEDQLEPKLTLSTADGASITLDGSPMQNILMLGPVAKGGPVVAFVQSYTGGMHCCHQMRVVIRDKAGLKLVELGAYDGMEIGWPKDVDGDGNLDFVVTDDRFLYAFESYAASVAPPKILNLVDGEVRDVSAEPRFAKVFEKAASRTRKACIGEEYPNGACAAWAASAARLGTLDTVWPVILAEYRKEPAAWPDRCKVDRTDDGECPEGQLVEYPDYPTGLRAYLVELGYIPAA
ncbi:hypothetical protein ABS767_04835 [Sphingomonas sp. ST-64]|uniref:Uncharacterized protein n=2 Tax=Sphingomonas plantiphila TaxID=3163295 RepID=A0ABW8YJ45_9SPHN